VLSKLAVCDERTLKVYRKMELCAMLGKLPSEIDREKAVEIELLLEYLKAKVERDSKNA